jgi:hypothetical protein
MKKILLAVFSAGMFTMASAQIKDTTASSKAKAKSDWKKLDLSNRANDHFMIQYGYDGWASAPDSASPGGFSRHFNFYFMLDKPFQGNPHYSAAIGVGLGSSNMFFENTYVNLKSNTLTLPFTNVSASTHFDKFKLTTMYFEIPLEFRFSQDPVTPDKGIKASLGLKFGTMLKGYTKGKNYLDASGNTIYGKNYIIKEQERKFLNSTRIAATARFGYGNFSIDGSYSLTPFLKTAAGPKIYPWSIGLTISGL